MTAFREAFPILYVDDVERAAAFYASTFQGHEFALCGREGVSLC